MRRGEWAVAGVAASVGRRGSERRVGVPPAILASRPSAIDGQDARNHRRDACATLHGRAGIGGGAAARGVKAALQFTRAVKAMSSASVVMAPMVIVMPVSPSKKKL